MKRENWNRDWYFAKGQGGLMQDGRRVQLPHDYMIESDVEESAPAAAAMGYFTGTVGTYTKYFHVPEEWQGELGIFMQNTHENTSRRHRVNSNPGGLQYMIKNQKAADKDDILLYDG